MAGDNLERTDMDLDSFRTLFHRVPLRINTIGDDGCLVAMNPAGLVQVGADREDGVCGRPCLERVSPQDGERVRCLMAEAFAGRPAEFEFEAAGPLPAHRLASCYTPVTDSEGKVTRPADIARCRPRTSRRSIT
jgi:PAS domain-containing protein